VIYFLGGCGFGVLAYIWITEEMEMSDKIYDILKWVALIFIPALGTLYFALSTIWGLPYGEQIVGTLTAVDTFLGALLGISTYQYNKEEE
jgi:hypothetical protein